METNIGVPLSRWPLAIAGNINLDIKTSLIVAAEGVMSDGETGIEEIYESLGGGGANAAMAAARLGGRVHFFGCVGDDELGDRLEAILGGYGIVAHLARKETTTGRSINLNWDNGCRHFISSLPNNRWLAGEDIDVEAMIAAGCRQLLRADVWFSESLLAEGNYALLGRARAAGIETYLDINWDPEWSVPGNGRRVRERCEQLTRVLPYINFAHGNERELAYFTGRNDLREACRFLLDQGCSSVVIHRGDKGAASFNAAEGWIEVPAATVESIVCSTACGDVFCAAHMLLHDLDTGDRLRASASIAADHLSGKRVLIPRLNDQRPGRKDGHDVHREIPV